MGLWNFRSQGFSKRPAFRPAVTTSSEERTSQAVSTYGRADKQECGDVGDTQAASQLCLPLGRDPQMLSSESFQNASQYSTSITLNTWNLVTGIASGGPFCIQIKATDLRASSGCCEKLDYPIIYVNGEKGFPNEGKPRVTQCAK